MELLNNRIKVFFAGMRDGVPIALGYLVVSFTLGIIAREAGLSSFQGAVTSFINLASAGEYAGFLTIKADAPYLEIIIITIVANIRYLLMSCVLSQRFSPKTSLWHRLGVGFGITDEIFGITIGRRGAINPYYNYGAMAVAVPAWSIGTAIGIDMGNILPEYAVSALGVALYGMFLAVIVPPAREDKILKRVIVISFVASLSASVLPWIGEISAGSRTIVLTLAISAVAAYLCPVKEKVK